MDFIPRYLRDFMHALPAFAAKALSAISYNVVAPLEGLVSRLFLYAGATRWDSIPSLTGMDRTGVFLKRASRGLTHPKVIMVIWKVNMFTLSGVDVA